MNMYILVNDDLKMGKGKIAGQVGHVVGSITEKIITEHYKKHNNDVYNRYVEWKNNGCAKIILKATEAQIKSYMNKPETMYILDLGRTQIPENSLTVIGFYPSSNLKEEFKNYKLL